MNEKYKSSNHFLLYSIPILFIFLVIIFIVNDSLTSGIFHIVLAQREQQQQQLNTLENNQTISQTEQQPLFIEDLSFDIDNVTFSHHMASVNGIQLHCYR